jgi:hypothetical protein
VRIVLLAALLIFGLPTRAQYAPAAGKPGSTALKHDSSCFINWASVCNIERGYKDISSPDSGFTTAGSAFSATGPALQNGVISLGDGGRATLEFPSPIIDGQGWDFAVFENTFLDTFLELAFVEVSTNGTRYVRFPSSSLTDTLKQTGAFGYTRPEKVNNLAGKYISGYGTPFDLNELKDSVEVDINNIRFVRVVDVVGSLQNAFCSRDAAGRKINDPWPTRFISGGFDLDAVGVIHQKWPLRTNGTYPKTGFELFPNPVKDGLLNVQSAEQGLLFLYDLSGREIVHFNIQKGQNGVKIDIPTGMYFVVIKSESGCYTKRVVFE